MFSPYFARYRRTTWAIDEDDRNPGRSGRGIRGERKSYVVIHVCLECTIQINWAVIAVALTIRYIDPTSTVVSTEKR